jgi:hypothetical protein
MKFLPLFATTMLGVGSPHSRRDPVRLTDHPAWDGWASFVFRHSRK